jgi:uncharacterized protein DUF3788
MHKPLLDDKDQYPTDEVIFSHIGKSRIHWEAMFDQVGQEHPDFTSEWKYYKDGNNWLLKTTRKSKTIFWLSVVPKAFTTTFYFGDKAEPVIMASDIPEGLKDSFVNGRRYGKIRGITVQVDSDEDVENVKKLIEIKMSIK